MRRSREPPDANRVNQAQSRRPAPDRIPSTAPPPLPQGSGARLPDARDFAHRATLPAPPPPLRRLSAIIAAPFQRYPVFPPHSGGDQVEIQYRGRRLAS